MTSPPITTLLARLAPLPAPGPRRRCAAGRVDGSRLYAYFPSWLFCFPHFGFKKIFCVGIYV